MVVFKENFWNLKGDDGEDRSHIPPTPYWIAIIRIVQLAMALLVLIIAAVAAASLGTYPSMAITFFTFAWTILHVGWLALSILLWPITYNVWAQLAVEILTVIFWLSSFAALAAEVGTIILISGNIKTFTTGLDCMKAAAGLGALEWILFVVTLVFFIISLVHHHKANAPASGTAGAEAVVTESKPLSSVEMAPVPVQQPYQDQPAVYQQQPGQPQVPQQQYQQGYVQTVQQQQQQYHQ